jgi:hypothetical protein
MDIVTRYERRVINLSTAVVMSAAFDVGHSSLSCPEY